MGNNWRPYSTTKVEKTSIKVRAIDLVWRTHRENVIREVKDILGTEEVNVSSVEFFQQRMAACKRVLEKMTIGEREEFDKELELVRSTGHPENIQRQ